MTLKLAFPRKWFDQSVNADMYIVARRAEVVRKRAHVTMVFCTILTNAQNEKCASFAFCRARRRRDGFEKIASSIYAYGKPYGNLHTSNIYTIIIVHRLIVHQFLHGFTMYFVDYKTTESSSTNAHRKFAAKLGISHFHLRTIQVGYRFIL